MQIAFQYFLFFAIQNFGFILIAAAIAAAFLGPFLIKRAAGPWLRTLIYSTAGSLAAVFVHIVLDESAKSESAFDLLLITVGLTIFCVPLLAPFVLFSQRRINKASQQVESQRKETL